MSRRRGLTIACAVAFGLGGLAWALAHGGGGEGPLSDESILVPATPDLPPSPVQVREQLTEAVERSAESDATRSARREDADGEPGPSAADLRHYDQLQAEAEPVARRFFDAFSLYELGRSAPGVSAALRATATPALARQLLAVPVRVPAAAGAPERAVLGRFELVPGEVAGGRIVAAELVGRVRRGAATELIAIELRLEDGRWLVSGLGR